MLRREGLVAILRAQTVAISVPESDVTTHAPVFIAQGRKVFLISSVASVRWSIAVLLTAAGQ